jgi:hypothetical protein
MTGQRDGLLIRRKRPPYRLPGKSRRKGEAPRMSTRTLIATIPNKFTIFVEFIADIFIISP